MAKALEKHISNLELLIPYVLKKNKIPGMAIGLVDEDQIIFSKGYGKRSISSSRKVDTKTLFSIGSATKSFTSLSMAMLEDEGKIKLTVPIKNYYKDFQLMTPELTNRVTVKDLLIHNTGLPRHDWYWAGSHRTRKELIEGLKYLVPWERFRSTYQYNNLMYMLCGHLIEVVTGESWESFVKTKIFNSLQMNGTGFYDLHKLKNNRALPHRKKDGVLHKKKEICFDAIGPAGSIVSNIEDMCLWLQFNINNGVAQNNRVVSKKMFKKIHTPYIKADPTFSKSFREFDREFYGLGWRIHKYRGSEIHWHSGGTDGFRSFVGYFPKIKKGVVVLANAGHCVGKENGVFMAACTSLDFLSGKRSLDWPKKYAKIKGS